jgi:hypothetical protein
MWRYIAEQSGSFEIDDRVEILHILHGKRDLGPLLKPNE